MNKLLLLSSVAVMSSVATFAQTKTPQVLNYQGAARNSNGTPLANTRIGIRLSIVADTEDGAVEYYEVRNVQTNALGLYTIKVNSPGALATSSADGRPFNKITWGAGEKYFRVEVDVRGGTDFRAAGTTLIASMPYAIYAEKGGTSGFNMWAAKPNNSGKTPDDYLNFLKDQAADQVANNARALTTSSEIDGLLSIDNGAGAVLTAAAIKLDKSVFDRASRQAFVDGLNGKVTDPTARATQDAVKNVVLGDGAANSGIGQSLEAKDVTTFITVEGGEKALLNETKLGIDADKLSDAIAGAIAEPKSDGTNPVYSALDASNANLITDQNSQTAKALGAAATIAGNPLNTGIDQAVGAASKDPNSATTAGLVEGIAGKNGVAGSNPALQDALNSNAATALNANPASDSQKALQDAVNGLISANIKGSGVLKSDNNGTDANEILTITDGANATFHDATYQISKTALNKNTTDAMLATDGANGANALQEALANANTTALNANPANAAQQSLQDAVKALATSAATNNVTANTGQTVVTVDANTNSTFAPVKVNYSQDAANLALANEVVKDPASASQQVLQNGLAKATANALNADPDAATTSPEKKELQTAVKTLAGKATSGAAGALANNDGTDAANILTVTQGAANSTFKGVEYTVSKTALNQNTTNALNATTDTEGATALQTAVKTLAGQATSGAAGVLASDDGTDAAKILNVKQGVANSTFKTVEYEVSKAALNKNTTDALKATDNANGANALQDALAASAGKSITDALAGTGGTDDNALTTAVQAAAGKATVGNGELKADNNGNSATEILTIADGSTAAFHDATYQVSKTALNKNTTDALKATDGTNGATELQDAVKEVAGKATSGAAGASANNNGTDAANILTVTQGANNSTFQNVEYTVSKLALNKNTTEALTNPTVANGGDVLTTAVQAAAGKATSGVSGITSNDASATGTSIIEVQNGANSTFKDVVLSVNKTNLQTAVASGLTDAPGNNTLKDAVKAVAGQATSGAGSLTNTGADNILKVNGATTSASGANATFKNVQLEVSKADVQGAITEGLGTPGNATLKTAVETVAKAAAGTNGVTANTGQNVVTIADNAGSTLKAVAVTYSQDEADKATANSITNGGTDGSGAKAIQDAVKEAAGKATSGNGSLSATETANAAATATSPVLTINDAANKATFQNVAVNFDKEALKQQLVDGLTKASTDPSTGSAADNALATAVGAAATKTAADGTVTTASDGTDATQILTIGAAGTSQAATTFEALDLKVSKTALNKNTADALRATDGTNGATDLQNAVKEVAGKATSGAAGATAKNDGADATNILTVTKGDANATFKEVEYTVSKPALNQNTADALNNTAAAVGSADKALQTAVQSVAGKATSGAGALSANNAGNGAEILTINNGSNSAFKDVTFDVSKQALNKNTTDALTNPTDANGGTALKSIVQSVAGEATSGAAGALASDAGTDAAKILNVKQGATNSTFKAVEYEISKTALNKNTTDALNATANTDGATALQTAVQSVAGKATSGAAGASASDAGVGTTQILTVTKGGANSTFKDIEYSINKNALAQANADALTGTGTQNQNFQTAVKNLAGQTTSGAAGASASDAGTDATQILSVKQGADNSTFKTVEYEVSKTALNKNTTEALNNATAVAGSADKELQTAVQALAGKATSGAAGASANNNGTDATNILTVTQGANNSTFQNVEYTVSKLALNKNTTEALTTPTTANGGTDLTTAIQAAAGKATSGVAGITSDDASATGTSIIEVKNGANSTFKDVVLSVNKTNLQNVVATGLTTVPINNTLKDAVKAVAGEATSGAGKLTNTGADNILKVNGATSSSEGANATFKNVQLEVSKADVQGAITEGLGTPGNATLKTAVETVAKAAAGTNGVTANTGQNVVTIADNAGSTLKAVAVTYSQDEADKATANSITNGGANGSGAKALKDAVLAATSGATTNTLTSATNTLTSTVNSKVATANIVNSISNTLTGTQLTTSVNGVTGAAVDLKPAIQSAQKYDAFTGTAPINIANTANASGGKDYTISVADATETTSGVVTLANVKTAANTATTNTLSSAANVMTSNVNSKTSTANIINSNTLTLDGANKLVSTINGVANATALDLAPAINANQKITTLKAGTNVTIPAATVTGNTSEYTVNVATATATDLGVVRADGTSITNAAGVLSVNTTQLQANQKTSSVVNGTNTTVTSTPTGNNTAYTVNVATATTGAVGVVKPSTGLTVATDGTLTVNTAAVALAGDVTGNANANTVTKIQNVGVKAGTPTASQVLQYNGTTNQWEATTLPVATVTTANNGTSLTGTAVQLGGALTKATTITTDATNTLAVAALVDKTTDATNYNRVLVQKSDGVLAYATLDKVKPQAFTNTSSVTTTGTTHAVTDANLAGTTVKNIAVYKNGVRLPESSYAIAGTTLTITGVAAVASNVDSNGVELTAGDAILIQWVK